MRMTTTTWANESANWNTTGDWSGGVPTISTDAAIDFAAAYTVEINTPVQANSLLFDAAGATLSETASGSLVAPNGVTIEAGTVVLHGANAFLSTTVSGGTLEIANINALGFEPLQVSGGMVTNIGNIDLTNQLDITGTSEFAAANGTTFDIGQSVNDLIEAGPGGSTVTFGDATHTGTIVWQGAGTFEIDAGPLDFVIADGTLRVGSDDLHDTFDLATSVIVAAGATLDIAGFQTPVANLTGTGIVTGSSGSILFVKGGDTFAGTITGALSLHGVDAVLTGTNTYTGTTQVDGDLQLGNGGTTGSIPSQGAIDIAAGALVIDHSNAVTIANQLTDAGGIDQSGTGTTLLSNTTNSYSGATEILAGTLEVKNSAALGDTAGVVLQGGTFLAGANVALACVLDVNANATVAAVAGRTLTTSTVSRWDVGAGTTDTLTFGSTADTGTVVWNTAGTASIYDFAGSTLAVHINGGTLRAGDDNFYFLTDRDINSAVTGTTIGAHGTLDAAGHGMAITNLLGSGIIENTGAATTLNVGGANFSGEINGGLTPFVSGAITLSGALGNFTAGISLISGTTLTLHGTSAHNYIFENHNGSTTTILLASDAKETGTVTGFDSIDVLDFHAVLETSATKSMKFNTSPTTGGVLTVTDGTHSFSIALAGDYTGATFAIKDDGHGGTDVTVTGPGLSHAPHTVPLDALAADALAAHTMPGHVADWFV
jgi:autotransporter-associated beta strand protein